MEHKTAEMNENDRKNMPNSRPGVPPNLFSERRPGHISRKKALFLTALFAIVSSVILLFPFKVSVKGLGQTAPAKIYSVCAETAGKIVEIYYLEGTQVIAGSAIARLSNAKLESTIKETQKRREIGLEKVGLLKAEKKARAEAAIRSKLYYEVGSISLSEKRQTQDLLIAIEREISIQNKAVEEIDTALNYLLAQKEKEIVKAPADGVILTPLKDRLEMVLTEGQEVFKLAGKETGVLFFIPEEQTRFVSIGSKVEMCFVSDPLKTCRGTVVRMDSKVDTQQEKVWITKSGVWATIKLDEPAQMAPGKKVQVWILSEYRRSLINILAAQLLR